MKNLISKFQEKLNVSKENAIFRVVMMLVFVVCFIVTIVVTLINFPYHYNYPVTKISVPNGNYEVVVSITRQGIQLTEKQFYDRLSLSDTIFVFVNSYGTAIFMVYKKGMSFYYKKDVVVNNSYFYSIYKISIDNGVLIVEKARSAHEMFIGAIVRPIFLLLLFLLFAFVTQFKEIGYGYNSEDKLKTKYANVWL